MAHRIINKNGMNHFIKKQIVQLRAENRQEIFQAQHLLSRFYWREIVPALDSVLDELSGPDELITIDRFVFDLGALSLDDLENGKFETIAAFRTELIKLIKSAGSTGPVQVNKTTIGICQQWLFYLEHGYLNWNTAAINEQWYQAVLEALAVDYSSVTSLRILMEQKPYVVKRIIADHDIEFILQLVVILSGRRQDQLRRYVKELTHLLQSDAELSELVLRPTAIWGSTVEVEELIKSFIRQRYMEKASLQTLVQRAEELQLILLPLLREVWSEPEIRLGKPVSETALEEAEIESEHAIPPGQIKELYTSYAGLVLLHPFLASFFNRLSLVEENQFKDLYCREKALYLLFYLVAGHTDPKDYELVIPKLIVDHPLKMPVPVKPAITDEDLGEARELLETVNQHWDKMKGSSIDALRESFLQRKGKLEIKDNEAHLLMETASIDVLLDYLPWNLSIIKLPWKKQLIKVDWR
jgi:hypothetical protein